MNQDLELCEKCDKKAEFVIDKHFLCRNHSGLTWIKRWNLYIRTAISIAFNKYTYK